MIEDDLFTTDIVIDEDDEDPYTRKTDRYFNMKEQCVIYEKFEAKEGEDKYARVSLNSVPFGGGETTTIAKNTSNNVFMPESNKLYFVKYIDEKGDFYSLYEYDFKKEPVLIEENAGYDIIALKNKKDILYKIVKEETIPYMDLVEDDKKEEDEKTLLPKDEELWGASDS